MAPSWHLLRNPWLLRSASPRRAAERLRARPHLETFEDRLALNYSFGATAFQPVGLSTADPAVFALINHADDLAVPVNLGANQFNFYGTTYQGPSSLYASSNGLITFGGGNSAYQNTDLTSQPFQPAIAPLWSDWFKTAGGPMLLGKLDTANNALILQWDQVVHQPSGTPATFQVVLQLNTGNVPGTITVNYLGINTGDRNANGGTSTVGVKDTGFQGANRALVSFNSTNPLIQSNQAVQFAWNNPNPPPSLGSLSLTAAPEGSAAQLVTLTGSNFVSNSTVQVNGAPVATTFQSATQLQAIFPAKAFLEEGSLAVSVLNPGSQAQTSNVLPFTVTDAPLSAAGGLFSTTEGAIFTGTVATFTDADPYASVYDYQATIFWGDGQSSPGTVRIDGQGGFNVSGTHTYEEGIYPLSVQIADVGGATATANSTVFVADAPLAAAAVAVNATEGGAFAGTVATFTDANPYATAGDFTATITWAQGQTTAGTVTVNPAGGFAVTGAFTYAEEGTYPISVTVTDQGGASAQVSSSATVADAPLTAAGVSASATEGVSLSGVVATFTDANPNSTAADFTATITWGDGHTSAGTITANPAGGFAVSGANTYAEEGSYPVSVSIVDQGGATAAASTTAAVVDAPLSANGLTLSATEGGGFHGSVATFTDANPSATAAEFTATILWGDGATSAGTITANADGSFAVRGDHTYAEAGSYPVTVAILDQGGSAAAAYGVAQVMDSIPVVNAWLFQGWDFQRVYLLVHFTDLERERHTVRIDWGDGTVTRERLGPSREGFLFLTHRYSERFARQHPDGTCIVVTVADGAGTTSDPEVLAVEFRHHHPW